MNKLFQEVEEEDEERGVSKAYPLFMTTPDFPKPRHCYYLRFCIFRHKQSNMAKIHFRSYNPNQIVLFHKE